MGCCGQNRAALAQQPPASYSSPQTRANPPGPGAFQTALSTPTWPPGGTAEHRGASSSARPGRRAMALRYVERNGVIVRGPASGIDYRFTFENPVQSVDVRDADSLLRSGLFMRA